MSAEISVTVTQRDLHRLEEVSAAIDDAERRSGSTPPSEGVKTTASLAFFRGLEQLVSDWLGAPAAAANGGSSSNAGDRILALLRERGERGVDSHELFYDEGITDYPSQVAWLRARGLRIAERSEPPKSRSRGPLFHYVLVTDGGPPARGPTQDSGPAPS